METSLSYLICLQPHALLCSQTVQQSQPKIPSRPELKRTDNEWTVCTITSLQLTICRLLLSDYDTSIKPLVLENLLFRPAVLSKTLDFVSRKTVIHYFFGCAFTFTSRDGVPRIIRPGLLPTYL